MTQTKKCDLWFAYIINDLLSLIMVVLTPQGGTEVPVPQEALT